MEAITLIENLDTKAYSVKRQVPVSTDTRI